VIALAVAVTLFDLREHLAPRNNPRLAEMVPVTSWICRRDIGSALFPAGDARARRVWMKKTGRECGPFPFDESR
jgi:hypothetical protein